MPDDVGLFFRFVSLGNNCEFGGVQRAFGAEPIDLFRWAGIEYPAMVDLLRNRFEGIGDSTSIEVKPDAEGHIINHTGYQFLVHSWVYDNGMSTELIRSRESRRLTFLARKMTEELASGERIFVIKPGPWLTMTEARAMDLLRAMHEFGGRPTLLYVTEEAAPAGAERVNEHLLHGHVPRFADQLDVMRTFNAEDWLSVCRQAAELVDESGWRGQAPP